MRKNTKILSILFSSFIIVGFTAFLISTQILRIPLWWVFRGVVPLSAVQLESNFDVTISPETPAVIGESIMVTVRNDSDSMPVENAKVAVKKNGDLVFEYLTNSSGHTQVEYVGEVTVIEVSKSGFNPTIEAIPNAPAKWVRDRNSSIISGLLSGLVGSIASYLFKKRNEVRLNASFLAVMRMDDLRQEEIRYFSDRNLTLAGFTLTALSLIIGFYRDNFSDAITLIVFLLISMFLFFLASQMAHSAERFWHLFTADIIHHLGVTILLLAFTIFINEKIQITFLTIFSFLMPLITILYLIRGIWNTKTLYKDYEKVLLDKRENEKLARKREERRMRVRRTGPKSEM